MGENALGKSEEDGGEVSGDVGSQSHQGRDGLVGIRRSFRGRVLLGACRDYFWLKVGGISAEGVVVAEVERRWR